MCSFFSHNDTEEKVQEKKSNQNNAMKQFGPMENLQDKIAVLTIKIGHLQRENTDLTIKMERVQNKNIDVISRIERLLKENEVVKNENTNLKTINELVQRNTQSIQLTNKTLQLQRLEYFEQTKQLQEEKNMIKNEIEKNRQEKMRIIEHHQQEESKINNQIEQFHQQEAEMHKEKEQLRLENYRLVAQIIQYRLENDKRNNENRQLREDISAKNNEIQQIEEDKNTISNEIEQLQRQNNAMRNELQALQREKTNMKIEIQQLQEATKSSFILKSGTVTVSTDVELGRGSYGAVYKGDFHGTLVAVKEYYQIIVSEYNMKILEREINIAAQCRHPNLLQFLCATRNDRSHLLIVTELMDMALRSLLEERARKKSRLDNQEMKSISLDVARGLNYLHSKKPSPIIHRDISSANVLLNIEHGEVRRAKISDYGSANFMELSTTPNPGAAIYAAPEASQAQQSPKVTGSETNMFVTSLFEIC